MSSWRTLAFRDFLRPNSRPVTLGPTQDADLVGMRLYGGGPFHRERKPALRIAKKSHFRIRSGDVIYNKLFAWKGTFGIVAPALDGMFVSDKFPTYELDTETVDAGYLGWYFRFPLVWEQARLLSTGSAALSKLTLNPPKFLQLTMAVPPMEEQRRLVARIERCSTAVREARGLRHQAETEQNALHRQMQLAVFERLERVHPSRCLGELVTVRGGGTPSKHNPALWQGSVPWVTPKDMKTREIHDSIDHISQQATKESPAKLLAPRTVLIVVRGMILAHTVPVAVLRVAAAINQDMKGMVPSDGLLPEFLAAYLWARNARLLGLVERSTHDTRKLRTDQLLALPVVLPPLLTQRQTLEALSRLESNALELKSHYAASTAELNALLPSILDRAFKGEL